MLVRIGLILTVLCVQRTYAQHDPAHPYNPRGGPQRFERFFQDQISPSAQIQRTRPETAVEVRDDATAADTTTAATTTSVEDSATAAAAAAAAAAVTAAARTEIRVAALGGGRAATLQHDPLILVKVRVVEVERNNGLSVASVLDYVSRAQSDPSLTSGAPLNTNAAGMGFENLSAITDFGVPGLISGGVTLPSTTGAGMLVNLTSEHINYVGSLLARELNADVITAPQVTTLHGKRVVFTAGSNIPFEVGFNTIQQNTNNVEQFVYSHVGTRIEVTPRIVNWDDEENPGIAANEKCNNTCGWVPEDCMVDLDILVRLSEGAVDEATGTNTEVNVRSISNQVQVQNGRGIVMGGLISARDVDVASKTPILGDLPGIGFFFRSKTTERSKAETLIFVEAHVLPHITEAQTQTQHDFALGQSHLTCELNCAPLIQGMHNAGLAGEYLPQPSHHEKDYWQCYHRIKRHERRHRIHTEVRDAFK